MIRITGGNFFGNNIIGGLVINGGGTGKQKRFDNRKSEDARNIEKITINSAVADINVTVSNSSKVESHFYGNAQTDGEIIFDVCMVNYELKITLKFIGNFYNGDLKLDVTVPRKIFKVITAITSSADVTLGEGVSADYIKVKTKSGDLEACAAVNNISVSTVSGDVELDINATKDISIEISTVSGDVSTKFNNVKHIELSASSRSGDIRNYCHKGRTGHTANVDISTLSGDISIK